MSIYMTDKVSVTRATVSVSEMREARETFATVADGVVCSLQNTTRDLSIVEAGQLRRVQHRAFFKWNADVRVGDRLIAANGDKLRVLGTTKRGPYVLVASLELVQ
jgi:hypothetical protein